MAAAGAEPNSGEVGKRQPGARSGEAVDPITLNYELAEVIR